MIIDSQAPNPKGSKAMGRRDVKELKLGCVIPDKSLLTRIQVVEGLPTFEKNNGLINS